MFEEGNLAVTCLLITNVLRSIRLPKSTRPCPSFYSTVTLADILCWDNVNPYGNSDAGRALRHNAAEWAAPNSTGPN